MICILVRKRLGGDCAGCAKSSDLWIGLNLDSADERYAALEPHVPRAGLLQKYLAKDFAQISWKQIFSNYELEFSNNKGFSFHHKDVVIPLSEAILLRDGTLSYKGEIIFNARLTLNNLGERQPYA